MADINIRKLPAGIQSFKMIREEGYVYVDKSDIVWYLANCGKLFNYLSRPRRFGKSILVDTLQMYFEGRKELFEGLKIMQLEKNGSNILLFVLTLAVAVRMQKLCAHTLTYVSRNMKRNMPSPSHLQPILPTVLTPSLPPHTNKQA